MEARMHRIKNSAKDFIIEHPYVFDFMKSRFFLKLQLFGSRNHEFVASEICAEPNF